MMPPRILPVSEQNATPPVLFDPDGDVLTTDHLHAFVEENRPMLNDYIRRVRIGKGQHGDVYLCHKVNSRLPIDHPERRVPVAMKSVKRNNPRAEQLKKLRKPRLPPSSHIPVADRLNTTEAKIKREIAIMKKLRHPHVVRLYEVIDDRIQEKIYMVMEYLGGGEVKWRDRDNNPVLTVAQTRRILRDAVLGLEYLHIQGIIHRDIKPANLLWTEDRRQVKIGDFGVSHFSYAQRLAAAGAQTEDDPNDPILLDESGLTRRAGTPSFLAPEVIYEHTNDVSQSISSNGGSPVQSFVSLPSPPGSLSGAMDRPEITKAIDVWALGVTFYCLLFGTTPFVPQSNSEGGSEYALYKSICNDDWPAPRTMGFDIVPSGGRHPEPGPDGANIIHLLDHFLQKDANLRITLDEVKRNDWFLKDLDNPQRWLQMTSPKTTAKINVSAIETTDAMSIVHFRWRWGRIAHHVSSFFRRPPRVKANSNRIPNVPNEIVSDPTARKSPFMTQEPSPSSQRNTSTTPLRRDKGKQKAESSKALKRLPSKGSKSLRSKSTERWPEKTRGSSTSTSALQQVAVEGSQTKPRRGSDPKVLDRAMFPPTTRGTRSQPTASSRGQRRARFTLFNVSNVINWRPNYAKFKTHPSSASVTAVASSTSTATSPMATVIPEETQSMAEILQTSRRSEEAHNRQPFDIDDPGVLTAARRASSWGQGDTDLSDMMHAVPSMGSMFNLNEQDMIVGAGGVAVDGITVPAVLPGPSTPRNAPRVMGHRHALGAGGGGTAGEAANADDDEYRRYGRPVYDDDSSTIASIVDRVVNEDEDELEDGDAGGSWHRGSELDADYDDDGDDDDDNETHDHDDLDQETSDDDDEEEEARGPVTFSPRRYGHANIDEGA